MAFHRRIAVLSVLVAMMAGSLDAMLWREAQRDAEQRQRAAAAAAAELAERETAAETHVLYFADHAGLDGVAAHGKEGSQCPHDRSAR